jgi:hypothetical protein
MEQVCDQFPGYYMKILIGDFIAKLGREGGYLKPIISNENLHEESNDNGIRVVNFKLRKI